MAGEIQVARRNKLLVSSQYEIDAIECEQKRGINSPTPPKRSVPPKQIHWPAGTQTLACELGMRHILRGVFKCFNCHGLLLLGSLTGIFMPEGRRRGSTCG